MSFDESTHWQLTELVAAQITTWATTNWSDATVKSAFLLEEITQTINASSAPVIGVLPSSVIDDVDGDATGRDQDLITILVVVLAHVREPKLNARVSPLDGKMNKLRRMLKGFQPAAVTVNNNGDTETVERRSIQYVTVFDHEALVSEQFASAIAAEYSLCLGDLDVD